jgi:RNA binding exosome subunit
MIILSRQQAAIIILDTTEGSDTIRLRVRVRVRGRIRNRYFEVS